MTGPLWMLCAQLGKRTETGAPAQVRGDRQGLGVRTGVGEGVEFYKYSKVGWQDLPDVDPL